MYIYGYKNKINGKWYVGKSEAESIYTRQNQHKKAVATNSSLQFHVAVRKYGWDNFEFNVLQFDINDRDYLAELERKYIKEKNSYRRGYNATEGGDGGNTWDSLSEARKVEANEKRSKALIKDWEDNRIYRLKQHATRDFSFRQTKEYREQQSTVHKKKFIVSSPEHIEHTFNGVNDLKEFFRELNKDLPINSKLRVSAFHILWKEGSYGWKLV